MSGQLSNMNRTSLVDVNSGRCLIALILLCGVGNGVLLIQPLTVGAMVDTLGFSERQAGFVIFAELASRSAGCMLMSGLIHRLNRRHVAYLGIALFALGSWVSSAAQTFLPFLLTRTVPGFGCALAAAAFVSTSVLTKVPDRTFGIVNAFSIAYSAVFLIIAPPLIQAGGLALVYNLMAVCALACVWIVRWIPERPSVAEKNGDRVSDVTINARGSVTVSIFVLVAMLLLYTGHGAIWAYQERIGRSLQIMPQAIGTILGVGMMAGIVGSLLAWRLGLAIGRLWPQIISLGLSVLAALLLVYARSTFAFAVVSVLVALTWFYGLPYQMGLLAQMDLKGRASVMGVIMTTGGASLGPAIAAMVTAPGKYASIGWLAAICYVLCLILVLPAVAFIGRRERVASS